MIVARRSILLVASVAMLVLTLSVYAAVTIRENATPSATVVVVPSSVNVRVNQTFEVAINVSGVSDLYGWEFKLGYNSSLLELVNDAEGSFLNSIRDTYFVPKVMSTDGYVLAGCKSLRNASGVSGNGTLATLEFRVKSVGSCDLDLRETKLVSSQKQSIAHESVDAYLTALIVGDANADNVVNILDAIVLANAFNSRPGQPNWNPYADMNGDQAINILDAILLANHFSERWS